MYVYAYVYVRYEGKMRFSRVIENMNRRMCGFMNVVWDLFKSVGGFFVRLPRELSKWILRKELSAMDVSMECRVNAIRALEDKNAELEQKCSYFEEKFKKSISCVLPNGVVAKIISYLPDPNAVGNAPELQVNKEFVLTGDYTKITDEDGRWWFEVKFLRLVKENDERINLEVSLRNGLGYYKLIILATIENLNGEVKTWVWNFYNSGIVTITDAIYRVIYQAKEAWCNVKRELFLIF